MRCERENTASVRSFFTSLASYPVLLAILVLQAACGSPDTKPLEFSGPTMGSHYSIKIPFAPADLPAPQLEQGISAILDDINRKMSTYLADSELSLINSAETTDWIPVSAELYEVLATAQDISGQTGGAFDITVGPLVNLWGFGPDKQPGQIPEPDRIDEARKHTGYRLLELRVSPRAVRKHDPRIYIDLSGIAAGYAADRVAKYLETRLIEHYLIDITGEIRARGVNQQQQIWRVGIEKPLIDRRDVQYIVALDNMGLTTAGDYRNFFVHDGRRYSHTIDPATGWPVAHDLTSVTVLDRSAMTADALDTAFMVMGPQRALEFAEQHHVPALFILNHNNEFTGQHSSPFSAYLIK